MIKRLSVDDVDNNFNDIVRLLNRIKVVSIDRCQLIRSINENEVIGVFAHEILIGIVTLSYIESMRGPIAYIGDLSVTKDGNSYGSHLVEECVRRAKLNDAYKVILTCKFELVPFYQKCGFSEGSSMVMYV